MSLGDIWSWAQNHKAILVLLSIILLGTLLRLCTLGAESVWLDEAVRVQFSQQGLGSMMENLTTAQNNAPLYFIILHFWMILFGTSEVAIRFLSAIFGIVSIFLVYKIGCQLFNREIGLIGGFLSAISFFHIFYSQDANAYALFLMLTLLSFFFFIRVLKSDNKWYYFGYFLANVLLVYSYLFGVFVIIAQIFYFALFWKKYKQKTLKFCGVHVASVVALIPLILLFAQHVLDITGGGSWAGGWIPDPSLSSLIETIKLYASGEGWGQSILLWAFLILCLIGLFYISRLKGDKKPKARRRPKGGWNWRRPLHSLEGYGWSVRFDSVEEYLLLVIWLVFPILLPFILSKVVTPVYVARYTISASPALLVLAAKGIGSFGNKKIIYCLVIAIALLSLPGLYDYYAHPYKEQWRETVEFIESSAQADDVIIIHSDYCQTPFDYYYEGELESYGIPRSADDAEEVDAVVDAAIEGKERLWLVLSNLESTFVPQYLVDRFGDDAVITARGFAGVGVYLFDLPDEAQ